MNDYLTSPPGWLGAHTFHLSYHAGVLQDSDPYMLCKVLYVDSSFTEKE